MKIAIAGAGMTGAYLYKLLAEKHQTVDIFDRNPNTRCGIKPCAWGTSRGFSGLVGASGLNPAHYILKKSDVIVIDGLTIPADLMTIDKSRLIRDLLSGAEINYGDPDPARYDRIIDATGAARAFLPLLRDDIILQCAQCRIETDTLFENRIQLGSIGYGWSFPLSAKEYHVGCGSLIEEPHRIMEALGWIDNERHNIRCACRGSIRLTAPQSSQPFVDIHKYGEVWGVGEAIGCVAPLAGDGIVPGMRSAQLLLACWDDPSAYTRAVLKEFHWMESERRVIDRLKNNERLSLRDALVLKKNSRRMGMQVGLHDAAFLLRKLR